jgi:hypothetical protein
MTETNWPQDDIDYAAGELAREYRTVSLAIIAMVVSIAAKNTDTRRSSRSPVPTGMCAWLKQSG